MGVSIYYTARRRTRLTPSETKAIDGLMSRYSFAKLMKRCDVSSDQFVGEAFSIYPIDGETPKGVILDGATKLPLCSEECLFQAVQYWCALLSEIRRTVKAADWHVHIDDADLAWDAKREEYKLTE